MCSSDLLFDFFTILVYGNTMIKVVINVKYGGFGLSHEAIMRYGELKGLKIVTDGVRYDSLTGKPIYSSYYIDSVKNENYFSLYDIEDRTDAALVQVVEELGELANGPHAQLKVVEIPDDVKWQIEEYDGSEWVAEQHRTWR